MKFKEFQQKDKIELEKILREDREKLRQLRFDLVLGKVKNIREVRRIKKDIARILTLLNSKHQAPNLKQ